MAENTTLDQDLDLDLHNHHHHHHHHHHTIHPFEHSELEDTVSAILFIFTGILCLLSNSVLLLTWVVSRRFKESTTPMTFQLFIYCSIEGLVTVVQSMLGYFYHYHLPPELCVASKLLRNFFEAYLLILIPLLMLERFIIMKHLYSHSRLRRFAIIATFLAVPIAMTSLLPMFPQLKVKRRLMDFSHSEADFEQTCHGLLNSFNIAHPIIILILAGCSLTTVISVSCKLLLVLKERLGPFSNFTSVKRQQMKRSTITFMVISGTFILMTTPHQIEKHLLDICLANDSDSCKILNFSLWLSAQLLYQLAHFVIPMTFFVSNKNLRNAFKKCVLASYENVCCKKHPQDSANQMDIETVTAEVNG